MDLSYDQIIKSLNSNFKNQLNTSSQKINTLFEEKKEEAIKQLENQKQKILENIKNSIKKTITEKIDEMFK